MSSNKKLEKPVKIQILELVGSRPDMYCEQRDVGFDELRKIKYGVKGEADIRILWLRKYRVQHCNHKSPFHQLERIETKIIGQGVAVETKRPKGGRQSPEQKKWQKAWEAVGGIYILANSVESFIQQLNAVDLQDEYILA